MYINKESNIMSAYNSLMKELNAREVYSNDKNEIELNKILTHRAHLYTAIESLDNYNDLMEENANYKTTGNLYSVKGLTFFDSSIQAIARAYEKSKEKYITINIGMLMEQITFKNQDDYLDKFQDAAINFQRSFNTYDDSKVKFTTYAYSYIKFGLLESYKKDGMINVQDGVRYTINRIKELRTKLAPRDVTIADIKKAYPDFTHKDIDMALTYEQPFKSLNVSKQYGSDEFGCEDYIDNLIDDNEINIDKEVDDHLLTKKVKQVIANTKSFSERDRKILTMRFGIELPDEYTLHEVGQQFNITKERVRQLESKALNLLKSKHSVELLEFY